MKLFAKLVLLLTLCASAFGQTVTPTNFNASGVGPKAVTKGQTRVLKGSDGFLRMVISDNTGGTGSVKFVHCLNTACTSTTTTTVYTGTANSCIDATDSGLSYSLSMYGDLPRIALQSTMAGGCTPVDPSDDTGVGLIVCGDAECSSHPLTYVGETESGLAVVQSVTTPGDTTHILSGSVLIESHHITVNLVLYTCSGAACGAGSVVAFADSRNGPCIASSNLKLGASNGLVFAYWSSGNSGTANTADCQTHLSTLHLWSNGADSVLDSTTLYTPIGIDMDAAHVPTIATTVATSFGGTIQLGIFRSGGKVTYTWPTQVTSQSVTAVSIAPDGFARIAITYAGVNGFVLSPAVQFYKCTNLSCSASTVTTIQSDDATHPLTGYYLSLFTGTVGGQVINNFGSRVPNCTASSYPSCAYTTANEVLYQIIESSPDFDITATPAVQVLLGL